MALVELAKYFDRFEADLVRVRLAAAGIECILFDVEMSWIGSAVPIRLMVDEEDKEEAAAILAEDAPERP